MTKHPFCCHIAVTPSFLHHHSTSSSKICCHTTITLLSHHYHRSHFFSKNQLLPRRISSSPRKPPLFSRKSPTFPRKCPMFFRKSGTSSKKALTSVAQPCDRCDRKKHKTPGIYARTRARRDKGHNLSRKAIIYRALLTCNHGERCCYGRTVESPHDYVLVASSVN